MIERETQVIKELMKENKKRQAMLALKKKVSQNTKITIYFKGRVKGAFDV